MRIAVLGWEEGLAGQVASWIEPLLGLDVACYVHPYDSGPTVDPAEARNRPASQFSIPEDGHYRGRPLVSSSSWITQMPAFGVDAVVCCLPQLDERRAAVALTMRSDLQLLSVVHPSSVILPDARIAPGCVIEPLCYVGYRAELGFGVHLHAGSQVDHHSVLEDVVTLYPGVLVAGNCLVGAGSTVGMGAKISNRVALGPQTVVGAGSTVLQSFPQGHQRLLGTPATRR